jgi:hypothetical protein
MERKRDEVLSVIRGHSKLRLPSEA